MDTAPIEQRQIACARCGAGFECRAGESCWCADEGFRIPLPSDPQADCLCPTCIRALASAQS